MTKPEAPKTPKELDAIVDVVLAYKPKAKAAKKRNKKVKKGCRAFTGSPGASEGERIKQKRHPS